MIHYTNNKKVFVEWYTILSKMNRGSLVLFLDKLILGNGQIGHLGCPYLMT